MNSFSDPTVESLLNATFPTGRLGNFLDQSWSSREIVNVVISGCTLLATALIPVVLACYQHRQQHLMAEHERRQQQLMAEQERRQQQLMAEHERRERLQRLEERLGKTNAFFVIQNFRDSCVDAKEYAFLYLSRRKEDGANYLELDTARAALGSIWDAIKDDCQEDLLPKTFPAGRPRVLLRGKKYMFLVEPLDCANWYRNKQNGRYIEETAQSSYKFHEFRPGRYSWIAREYNLYMEGRPAGEQLTWKKEFKEHCQKLLGIGRQHQKLQGMNNQAPACFRNWEEVLPHQPFPQALAAHPAAAAP